MLQNKQAALMRMSTVLSLLPQLGTLYSHKPLLESFKNFKKTRKSGPARKSMRHPGYANRKGRLCTVDLPVELAHFIKLNIIFSTLKAPHLS